MTIVIMGAAGAGKTTIGTMLAHGLGCEFANAESRPAEIVCDIRLSL